MLANRRENYAWQEQPAQEVQKAAQQKVRHEPDKRRVWRNRVCIVAMTIMIAYAITVCRSLVLVQHGNQLVALQQQETQLIKKNNELKIEVEQLKGPDRIIGLAEQQLGMSVARSNIYLKADKTQKNGNSIAAKDK